MLIHKAFKFELMPNDEHIRKMKQFCGCARFVFNRALAYHNEQYQKDDSCKTKFSYKELANLLPKWKQELLWLKDCHSQVLQQSLKDLESAFKNFFAKRVVEWRSFDRCSAQKHQSLLSCLRTYCQRESKNTSTF